MRTLITRQYISPDTPSDLSIYCFASRLLSLPLDARTVAATPDLFRLFTEILMIIPPPPPRRCHLHDHRRCAPSTSTDYRTQRGRCPRAYQHRVCFTSLHPGVGKGVVQPCHVGRRLRKQYTIRCAALFRGLGRVQDTLCSAFWRVGPSMRSR
jgi:hypothetical protein